MRWAAIVLVGLGAGWSAAAGGCAGARSEAAASAASEQRFGFVRVCMGVRTSVTLYAQNEAAASDAAAAAFARIGELDACMSDYRPQSELMRLCAADPGAAIPVSPDLFEILRVSQQIARGSGGAFDVTIGPAVQLWRAARRSGRLPTEAERTAALEAVGWQHLLLDERRRTVTLERPRMRLDLGGIAKGYAAEMAVETLEKNGFPRALVALEGDISAGDAPPGERGWRIAVAGTNRELILAHGSVSTAGDEGQFVELEGKRYSHIIDPRTGLGSEERRSVTVVAFGHGSGARADGLDTPIYLIGPERGMELIKAMGPAAAIMRDERTGEVRYIDPHHLLGGVLREEPTR